MDEVHCPDGWAIVSLGDIALWGSGGTPSRKNPDYYRGNIPWVKTGDLGPKLLTSASECITKAAVQNSSAKYFPKGSVVIAMYGATIGKTSILGIDATTNQACAVGQPIGGSASTEFLYYLLRNEKDNFIAKGKGGAQPNISQALIKEHKVLLPPLSEQKQIAAKLDELLAQVDTIKTRLDAIPAILKRFRQSVLAAAVSGRLTEEWRTQNVDKEDEWEWLAAKDLCVKVQSGSTPKNNPFEQGGTIPFLKVYNIVNQKIDFDCRPQFVTEDIHQQKLKRSIAYPSDVLMNIVGPPLGKVAILTDQYPAWNLNQAITLFRVEPSKLKSKYLYYVLCEGALVRSILHETKGIVGQVNISLTQCRESLIPRPAISEQEEIVRRIDQVFLFADQIEQRVKDAQSRVNHLTQSILAKAFRGELTAEWREQNPSLISGENSAQALLERIKAEQSKLSPAKRGRRKKA